MATLADVTTELSTLNSTSTETKTVMEKIHQLLEQNAASTRAAGRNAREAAGESRSRIAEGAANFGNAAASVGGGLIGLGAGVAGFMAALSVGSIGLDWLGADYSGLGRAFASFSEAMENLTPAAMIALAGASVIAAKTSSLSNLYGLGTASGMVGLGAGISGFLIGLSLGEFGLSWLGNDYTNLGGALASFSEAIGNLSLEAVALIGGVAGIAVANAAFGGNAASLALSMTGVGAGIAGFLAGLVLADVGIDWIQNISGADGAGLTSAFKMFNDAIMTLTPVSIAALGGLLAVATKFTLPVARIVMGMTGIGAGIAAFMFSLAVGDAGVTWIQDVSGADGSALVSVMTMFNNAVNALDTNALATLGVLMGIGIALGPGAAVGLGAMGVGIAAFITGLALGDGMTQLISSATGGEPGEGLKMLITNIFEGVAGIRALDGLDLVGLGAGLGAVAVGLGAFGISTGIAALGQAVEGIVAFFTGESVFDQIMKIGDRADSLLKGAEALERIAEALQKFGNIEINADNFDFEALSKNLIRTVPLLEMLAHGGETGAGWWDGEYVKIEKGLLDESIRLDDMIDAISKVNYILGKGAAPTVSQVAPQSLPNVGAADIEPVPVYDQQIPALVAAITAAQPNRPSGGGGSTAIPVSATEEHTLDLLDARSGRR